MPPIGREHRRAPRRPVLGHTRSRASLGLRDPRPVCKRCQDRGAGLRSTAGGVQSLIARSEYLPSCAPEVARGRFRWRRIPPHGRRCIRSRRTRCNSANPIVVIQPQCSTSSWDEHKKADSTKAPGFGLLPRDSKRSSCERNHPGCLSDRREDRHQLSGQVAS